MPPKPAANGKSLLLTVPAAADRLGVSRKTFNRMIDAGEVAYVQFVTPNGARWVEETELLRLIKKFRVKAHGGSQLADPAPAHAA